VSGMASSVIAIVALGLVGYLVTDIIVARVSRRRALADASEDSSDLPPVSDGNAAAVRNSWGPVRRTPESRFSQQPRPATERRAEPGFWVLRHTADDVGPYVPEDPEQEHPDVGADKTSVQAEAEPERHHAERHMETDPQDHSPRDAPRQHAETGPLRARKPVPNQDPAAESSSARRRRVEPREVVSGRSGGSTEFNVVPEELSSARSHSAQSRSVALNAREAISDRGRTRGAFGSLVDRVAAAGWRHQIRGAEWYEGVFVRDAPDEAAGRAEHCVVRCRRSRGEARFEALRHDEFGKVVRLAASPSFAVRRLLPVRPTDEARAMHGALVGYLQRVGWEISERSASE